MYIERTGNIDIPKYDQPPCPVLCFAPLCLTEQCAWHSRDCPFRLMNLVSKSTLTHNHVFGLEYQLQRGRESSEVVSTEFDYLIVLACGASTTARSCLFMHVCIAACNKLMHSGLFSQRLQKMVYQTCVISDMAGLSLASKNGTLFCCGCTCAHNTPRANAHSRTNACTLQNTCIV